MHRHRLRYILVLVATLTTIVGLVLAGALGSNTTVLTALAGALGVLAPALVDAHLVEQRRKDPHAASAVGDDVEPAGTVEVEVLPSTPPPQG